MFVDECILQNIFRILQLIIETISTEHKRVKKYENLLLRRIENVL